MYSTHNDGKSVIAESSLKNKIYKYMTTISKDVYINRLYDIVNNYNNTYHSTIKMKPTTYIESSKEIIDEDYKSKIGDIVRISKYKNIFAKVYVPYWSEKVFVIKKVENTIQRILINYMI